MLRKRLLSVLVLGACICGVGLVRVEAAKKPKATKVPEVGSGVPGENQPASTENTAGSTYAINNDGKVKDKKDIYCDSGIPSSFNDVKYYDVAVPYKLSCKDIGGFKSSMPSSIQEIKQGTGIQYEGNYTKMLELVSYNDTWKKEVYSVASKHWTSDLKGDKTEKTGNGIEVIVDKNGTEYIATAVQPFFMSGNKNNGKDFPTCGIGAYGTIIDAIMTDGSIVHMIYADTNGNTKEGGGNYRDVNCSDNSKVNYKQYQYLFSSSNGNNLELVFGDKKSVGESVNAVKGANSLMYNGKRSIAYYRVYNKKFKDAPKPATDAQKSLFTNVGNLNVVANGASDEDKKKAKENGGVVSTGMYSENEFVQDKAMNDIMVEFAKLSDLSDEENENLELWKGDLSKTKEENILINGGRIVVMFAGIVFTIWMLLIYLAYWLDRVNNFIDIDFLPIITFKKLRISPTEEECTFSVKDLAKGETRTINHKHVIGVCICGIVFGCLIITGMIFTIVSAVVNKVLSFL